MQHKIERKHIRNLIALDFARDNALKMRSHSLCCYFLDEEIIGCPVGSKESDIGYITLVAGTGMGYFNELFFHDSSTLTLMYSSMTERGARVGQMPSRPRGSIMPPAPPMKGGPLSANGGNNRPSFAASFLSAQRTAIRRYTSFKSFACVRSASGPWIE